MRQKILALYPNHISTYGNGDAALSIVKAMHSTSCNTLIISTSSDSSINTPHQQNTIPSIFKALIYKLVSANTIKACTEYIFLKQINPGDIIYLWPGTSLKLFEEIEKLGNTIVFENINCHQQLGKKILDSESQRINLIDSHAITTEKITDENNKLQICDFVFSPSPSVSQSLLKQTSQLRKLLILVMAYIHINDTIFKAGSTSQILTL